MRQQIDEFCCKALSQAAGEPQRQASFDDWVKNTAAFIKTAPSGWITPTPTLEAEKGASLQPDGSVLLNGSTSKPTRGRRGDSWSFRFKPGNLSIARIRLVLLPHATHGGKIIRGDGESASVRLAAAVRGGKTAAEKPLAFFQAEADVREPRYANGYELPGILNGWQTAKNRKNTPQTAIFALDAPVELTAGDELKIVVQTDRAGCIRISLSPLGFDPLNRPGLDDDEAAALTAEPDKRTPRQRNTR